MFFIIPWPYRAYEMTIFCELADTRTQITARHLLLACFQASDVLVTLHFHRYFILSMKALSCKDAQHTISISVGPWRCVDVEDKYLSFLALLVVVLKPRGCPCEFLKRAKTPCVWQHEYYLKFRPML